MNQMTYLIASADMRQHLLQCMTDNQPPTLSTLRRLMVMDAAVIGSEYLTEE